MSASAEIGKQHEERVEKLLQSWELSYTRKKKCRTAQGAYIELDFWLPPNGPRPPVVIECKTFGVAAKHLPDSRRRKAQESLHLLVQVRRHCPETKGARIIIVSGPKDFLPEQADLLRAELGPDFHIVPIRAPDEIRSLLIPEVG
jgi:hypothetical protein